VARALGERSMLPTLVEMLVASGRVRPDTRLVTEFAWRGRRVDLATLTRHGVSSAYELKMGSFARVLEQAIYNRLSFDRSWLVVDAVPSASNLEQAKRQRVGVIVVRGRAQIVLSSPLLRNEPVVRTRLAEKIRAAGQRDV
jgi:hypothetical protein